MSKKKYTGQERREQHAPYGGPSRETRREARAYPVGRVGRQSFMVTGMISQSTRGRADHAHHGIIDIKEHVPSPERRFRGAGRRGGDLARALETGESVIFQMGKGAFKQAGKLAKRALKKAGPLGAALTIGGIASQAKAATKGLSLPKTQYKGEKNLLPAKPKVKSM